MWRYQTSDRSGREEQWQLDAQQDHASMYGVGLSSPHTMPSAWKFGNAPLKQPDDQPVAAGSSQCGGNWRTLPFHDRWQLSTPMLPFQSAGIFNQYCTGSASAPAHDPACFDQAAQAGYPQYSLADTQWQSPSSYRSGCQRHRFVLQQPAQLHSALTAALSLTAGAAGKFPFFQPEAEA